jgi:hypothetical protein
MMNPIQRPDVAVTNPVSHCLITLISVVLLHYRLLAYVECGIEVSSAGKFLS